MKTLSLKQPFAELVVSGKKKIELRNWNTKFRGEFLIHASLKPDKKAIEKFDLNNLDFGCIIGKAFLKDVKKYNSEEEYKKDKKLHLADSSWSNYGFIIKNPEIINPIPVKGKLNFWEFPIEDYQ